MKDKIRDAAIIAAGLAGAFVFFLVVVAGVVGLPAAAVFASSRQWAAGCRDGRIVKIPPIN